MKHRFSRQTKEILAIAAFSFFAGWIFIHLAYEMFINLEFERWYSRGISTYTPMFAMTVLGLLIAAAITRFVVLIRHRVPYGHCPHCGCKLESDAQTCSECNGFIRKSRNEHEKRTKHIGVVRRAIIALAWCSLITWWSSTIWETRLETPSYVGGDGQSINLDHGGLQLARRRVQFGNTPAPAQFVPEMLNAVELEHDRFRWNRAATNGFNTWWFRRDTGNTYPQEILDALRNAPQERMIALYRKHKINGPIYIYTEESLEIPLWLPTALFGALALILKLRDRAFPPGCCQTCGYDLDSVAGPACPECGTPKTESTYGIPTSFRRRKA